MLLEHITHPLSNTIGGCSQDISGTVGMGADIGYENFCPPAR